MSSATKGLVFIHTCSNNRLASNSILSRKCVCSQPHSTHQQFLFMPLTDIYFHVPKVCSILQTFAAEGRDENVNYYRHAQSNKCSCTTVETLFKQDWAAGPSSNGSANFPFSIISITDCHHYLIRVIVVRSREAWCHIQGGASSFV